MRSFDASPLFSGSVRTPMESVLQPAKWTNSVGSDTNERVMPTPRNLTRELFVTSPWMRSLDVPMTERYMPVKMSTEPYIVPQLSLPSMFTFRSPGLSPPRNRRRLN